MAVRGWSEITAGKSASLSLNATGGGRRGLQFTRAFKILTDNPGDIESTDVQAVVGVAVGDLYPGVPAAVCDSLQLKPDGDSRVAWTLTATYTASDVSLESGGGSGGGDDQTPDPRSQSPEVRPANWTTSTTTIEVPSWWWMPVDAQGNAGAAELAANPVGDMYDGITILQPIVNISVEQYVSGDQLVFSQAVGKVNSNQGRIGSLNLFPRSVLFRSIACKPHTERIGRRTWRGWLATFEFSYKPNYNNYLQAMIGWDIAIPITGFNCINNGLGNADVETGALALELEDESLGVIKNWPNPAICPGLVGEKVRANVLVSPDRPGVKAAQRPSAQPIPLNRDGTPRNQKLPANQRVLIQRAQIYDAFDMSTLGLRFRS